MAKKQSKPLVPISFRPTTEDAAHIERIKKGIEKQSGLEAGNAAVIRLALKELARKYLRVN